MAGVVMWLMVELLLMAQGALVQCIVEGNHQRKATTMVWSLHELQAGEKNMMMMKMMPHHQQHSSSSNRRKSTTLELKYHSASAAAAKKKTPVEQTLAVLAGDAARVSSFQFQLANAASGAPPDRASKAQLPLTSGVGLQTLNYVVTILLGGAPMTVIVDTGSDLTWVQCKPCSSCHDQLDPLFDPNLSPSYRAVDCNSSVCTTLPSATGISATCGGGGGQQSCTYSLSYGDGSFSYGVLSEDAVELAGVAIDEFIFGCGTSNQGLFGSAAGVMGLGRNEVSLVVQTAVQFSGVFSYCMPRKQHNASGSLVLGDDPAAYRNMTPVVYAGMVADPAAGPFYFVNLTGITVGGRMVPAAASGRTIIDSGTIITRLPPSVYRAVRSAFLAQFSPPYPVAPGFSILDTCFNLTGFDEVKVPTLRLEFDGGAAVVEVDAGGVLYFVGSDAAQVCLALAPLAGEYETGIIGNYQQRNLRVVYDTAASRLGFAEESCDYP